MNHNLCVQLVEQRLDRFSDKLALCDFHHEYSYNDVFRLCRRVASGLRSLGITEGDRVVLILPNTTEFMFAHLGVLALGAISVPLEYRVSDGYLHNVLDTARPSL